MRKKVIKKMRQSNSTLIGAFLIGIILLLLGFGFGGYDYLQVQGLIAESKQLSNAGKYREALNKLEIAQTKWSLDATKNEIKQELHMNTDLAESSDNFEQGKIQYDGENYEKAIEYFDKVIVAHENYKTAQSYNELAEMKLAEAEKAKNAEVKTSKLNQSAQYVPLSSPTPVPTQQVANLAALCKSDVDRGKAEARVKWNDLIVETMKDPIGAEFLNSQGAYRKAQYFAEIDRSLAYMEQYCLQHNRDYTGYTAPQ